MVAVCKTNARLANQSPVSSTSPGVASQDVELFELSRLFQVVDNSVVGVLSVLKRPFANVSSWPEAAPAIQAFNGFLP